MKYDNETLNERELTHGDFGEQSAAAQSIKQILVGSPRWPIMTLPMRESLELIATKLARLTHGDPTHRDTWDDIAGYAQLISTRLSHRRKGGFDLTDEEKARWDKKDHNS
jgi:hypothetical protein